MKKELPVKIQAIANRASSNGFNPVVGTIWLMMDYWKSWWRGNVNGFHHYTEKRNGISRDCERKTLNTFKMVCEEWSSLIWSEKVKINITNSDVADKQLKEVLKENNDYNEMGNLFEKTFAIGNGATIVYNAQDKTTIDYISGQRFIPLGFKNNRVTALLTFTESKVYTGKKEKNITHVTYHFIDDGKYFIKHEVFVSDDENELGDYNPENILYVFSKEEAEELRQTIKVNDKEMTVYMTMIETDTPFFQLYRPNIANNYDESGMGVSIGANTIDINEGIDIKYDASINEILNNKTRIVVNSDALKRKMEYNEETESDYYIQYLDDQDTVIMAVPFGDDDEEQIKHFQGDFRTVEIKEGLHQDIELLGWRSGFGKKYFNFADGEAYVNERSVITSNSALFANKKKHENLIEQSLIEKAKAIMYLEIDKGLNADFDTLEYEVIFDDSIINDDETVIEKYRKDAIDGVIPLERYLMKAYKITLEEANQWIKETTGIKTSKTDALARALESGAMSIKQAQALNNEDTMTEEELEMLYIQTLVEKSIPLTPQQANKYNGVVVANQEETIDNEDIEEVIEDVMDETTIKEDEAQVETSYNGAQIQSAVGIVKEFALGSLSKESALAMLMEFLRIDKQTAETMLVKGKSVGIE